MEEGELRQLKLLSSMTQYFKDLCPFLMSIGQSRDEFWFGDPSISNDYIKAQELCQDRENHSAWIQGHYMNQAMEIALLNCAGKKAKSQLSYLGEIQILPRTEEQLDAFKQKQEKENYQKIKGKIQAKIKGGR